MPGNEDIVQSYLDKDPLHNIIMIHGLQTHGLDSKRVSFWGMFKDDRLEGVFFADNDSNGRLGCLAGDNPQVLAQLGRFSLESGVRKLIGKSTYIQPAVENLYSHVMVKIRRLNFVEDYPERLVPYYDHPVRVATEEDIPLLIELYRDYEFSGKSRPDEEIEREIQRFMDESGIYFYISIDGRAVSAARVVSETDRAAVIDAGRTLPDFRGRGLYPAVRTACCEHLFKKGKIAVSYHRETNDGMRRIIEKCGGSITAKWLLVHFKEKPPLRQRIFPRRLHRWGSRLKRRALRQ